MQRLTLTLTLILTVLDHHTKAQSTQQAIFEGCSASPGTQKPPECGSSVSPGNQWDKNGITCHVDQGYQLKCSYNHNTFSANLVDCTVDPGVSRGQIKFSCDVDNNCQIMCNWAQIQGIVPGVTYSGIRRILTAWKPRFELIG